MQMLPNVTVSLMAARQQMSLHSYIK